MTVLHLQTFWVSCIVLSPPHRVDGCSAWIFFCMPVNGNSLSVCVKDPLALLVKARSLPQCCTKSCFLGWHLKKTWVFCGCVRTCLVCWSPVISFHVSVRLPSYICKGSKIRMCTFLKHVSYFLPCLHYWSLTMQVVHMKKFIVNVLLKLGLCSKYEIFGGKTAN